jgi:hypothetical protein
MIHLVNYIDDNLFSLSIQQSLQQMSAVETTVHSVNCQRYDTLKLKK